MFPGNWTHNLLRYWRNALPLSHTGTHCSGCFSVWPCSLGLGLGWDAPCGLSFHFVTYSSPRLIIKRERNNWQITCVSCDRLWWISSLNISVCDCMRVNTHNVTRCSVYTEGFILSAKVRFCTNYYYLFCIMSGFQYKYLNILKSRYIYFNVELLAGIFIYLLKILKIFFVFMNIFFLTQLAYIMFFICIYLYTC